MQEIPSLAEDLLAPQEGLCSMEFFTVMKDRKMLLWYINITP